MCGWIPTELAKAKGTIHDSDYLLPVIGFLLGYFLSAGLAEGTRYIIAIAAAAVSFMPSVFYDRYAKRHEVLTYTIVRLF